MGTRAAPGVRVARLGWLHDGDWLVGQVGPNREAAERTITALEEAGRVEVVDAARVTAFRMLAESCDNDPTNATLWGQYRAAEAGLREVNPGDDSTFAALLAELAAGPDVHPAVFDAAKPEPADKRRRSRQSSPSATPAADAVAAVRGGRRRGTPP